MGALKHYYSEEVRTFMWAAGRPVTHFDVSELFGKAYLKTQTEENAVKDFVQRVSVPLTETNFQMWILQLQKKKSVCRK
jgi:hypothetical protein